MFSRNQTRTRAFTVGQLGTNSLPNSKFQLMGEVEEVEMVVLGANY